MLQQILSTLTDKPAKARLDERCLEYAHEHAVPKELLDTLEECAYAGPIRIGPVWLSPLAEFDLENAEEENEPCLEHGFLIVGSGLNGDPIAVELASGNMAFISHDILWERAYEDFRECVVRTPLGFQEFWTQASESADFPRDSYAAEQRWARTPTRRAALGDLDAWRLVRARPCRVAEASDTEWLLRRGAIDMRCGAFWLVWLC